MCGGRCKDLCPVILITLTVVWSYYVYVVEICWLVVESQLKFWCYLLVYHFVLIIMVVMYFLCMFNKEWIVPDNYFIPKDDFDQIASAQSDKTEYNLLLAFVKRRQIHLYTRSVTGMIRFCSYCQVVKPDRTHHCSTCESCVLLMDHHCPWVNNCIGFTNYKYFMMLILYSAVYCTFYFGTSLEYTITFILEFEKLREVNIALATLATFIMAITFWALMIFHVRLISINETTIEAMYPPRFVGHNFSFDKGCAENFSDHCSRNPLYWCLPVNTMEGNGTDFDVYSY